MELHAGHFADFFRAVHGHEPFPWQQALVDRLADSDEWPDVLDLPTGAGKTAALDAAVFHLALRADTPGKAALRVALVVDRRLVVDDAFARAEKISRALSAHAKLDNILGQVARRLQRLAGEDAPPLVARRLRGGAPLERDWVRTPTQPTILCSTVDQVGSRLLFRGYGVSDRMKPVHAGLLGTDSLILLDEAHLSEPFRQTLGAVRRIGGAEIRTALLSATPGTEAERPLSLSLADRVHPTLRERLEARKPAALTLLKRKDAASAAKVFTEQARAMAGRLRNGGVSPAAVGVVVNRVALAREIFELLRSDDEADAILMIGRSRDVDRDTIASALAPFRTGSNARTETRSLFVVATQCLEVGVDLDLDGLVTQAASLDALRQRFGRLNRAGRPICAEGAILARTGDVAMKTDDPVYGDRIRLTWEALDKIAEGGKVDFGSDALPCRLEETGIDPTELAALRPDAPVVMPAYLDLWSHTSPRPAADPEVALFLHGVERSAAGVSIVWRGDIREADFRDGSPVDVKEVVRLVPPRTAEGIEVPLWVARTWLQRPQAGADISDAPAREAGLQEPGRVSGAERRAFRWAGADEPRTGFVEPDDLRPGDLLVVPAEYGGCDRFGWNPGFEGPVEDVADRAAEPWWGRRCAVRIASGVVNADAQWDRVSAALADESLTGRDLADRLIDLLPARETREDEAGEEGGAPPSNARVSLEALRRARGRIDIHFPYGRRREDGAVLVAGQGIEDRPAPDAATAATEDDSASHTSAHPVPLDDHGQRVADFAEGFAQTLGLTDIVDDLRLAAFLHDAGKADPRFQTMLSGGDPWNRPDGPPLAKSGRSWSPAASARAGLPTGWRHEALSVRMARAHPRLAEAHDPALVLWLIGTHHGLGRPFFGFLDPSPEQELPCCLDVSDWQIPADQPGPQSLAFDLEGADWPCLFQDLKRRYGIWGLAHLEAVLRLADHRASEAERAL